MKRIILTILFFSTLSCYSQLLTNNNIYFNEKQADTLNIKLDSILIVGMGSSLTRIFLTDVSNTLIKKLNDKKIAATYFYLGKNAEDANKEFSLIDKDGYKAILYFIPIDTALFVTKESSSSYSNPYGTMRNRTSKTVYQQAFNLKLSKTERMNENFWSAVVEVECDPSKKNAAEKLVKKLYTSFIENKYFE